MIFIRAMPPLEASFFEWPDCFRSASTWVFSSWTFGFVGASY